MTKVITQEDLFPVQLFIKTILFDVNYFNKIISSTNINPQP